MKEKVTFKGDGVLNINGIIEKAEKVCVKHFFVEQDMVANPEIALSNGKKITSPSRTVSFAPIFTLKSVIVSTILLLLKKN